MKTPTWLAVVCMAASLPVHAEIFKPIELKDSELASLRGRYVMPGRIVSFGIVMTSVWQNANGSTIGATTTMQVQQNTIKPQFYVSMINDTGTGNSSAQGTGSVTGGGGLNSTNGVTQVVRAAGDNNTAYNDVGINVTRGNQAPTAQPQGEVLASGSTLYGSNEAGAMSVSATGNGVQLNIAANHNQGNTMQRLAQGGLMQNTTLLGAGNQVRNITSLNVVLRDAPSGAALTGNLDQLKGLRTIGF